MYWNTIQNLSSNHLLPLCSKYSRFWYQIFMNLLNIGVKSTPHELSNDHPLGLADFRLLILQNDLSINRKRTWKQHVPNDLIWVTYNFLRFICIKYLYIKYFKTPNVFYVFFALFKLRITAIWLLGSIYNLILQSTLNLFSYFYKFSMNNTKFSFLSYNKSYNTYVCQFSHFTHTTLSNGNNYRRNTTLNSKHFPKIAIVSKFR